MCRTPFGILKTYNTMSPVNHIVGLISTPKALPYYGGITAYTTAQIEPLNGNDTCQSTYRFLHKVSKKLSLFNIIARTEM